jgi:hypothetical protein
VNGPPAKRRGGLVAAGAALAVAGGALYLAKRAGYLQQIIGEKAARSLTPSDEAAEALRRAALSGPQKNLQPEGEAAEALADAVLRGGS